MPTLTITQAFVLGFTSGVFVATLAVVLALNRHS